MKLCAREQLSHMRRQTAKKHNNKTSHAMAPQREPMTCMRLSCDINNNFSLSHAALARSLVLVS